MSIPTDEQLEKRAEALANERYPFPEDEPSWDTHMLQVAWSDATMSALEVHRQSYRLLMAYSINLHPFECDTNKFLVDLESGSEPEFVDLPCTCGIDAHMATLRHLLGIADTSRPAPAQGIEVESPQPEGRGLGTDSPVAS